MFYFCGGHWQWGLLVGLQYAALLFLLEVFMVLLPRWLFRKLRSGYSKLVLVIAVEI